MREERMLLTGATGFLGAYLVERLSARYRVVCLGPREPCSPAVETVEADLTDPGLEAVVKALRVRWVVHAAAWTDPDQCQREPQRAHQINVEGTRRLAEAAAASCKRFIFCSSDLVFGGQRGGYRESDVPRPQMVYGRTKLAGEQAVARTLGAQAVTVRLSLLYGAALAGVRRPPFMETMLEEGRRGRPVRLFIDQYRSPLYVEDAARAIDWLLALRTVPRLLHLGGPERLSRYQMGRRTFLALGLEPKLAVPVRREDVTLAAPRPRDASLDIGRLRALGFEPRALEEALRAMSVRWNERRP